MQQLMKELKIRQLLDKLMELTLLTGSQHLEKQVLLMIKMRMKNF